MQKTFAEIFRAACKNCPYSLSELARRLTLQKAGVNRSTLTRWLNNTSQPGPDQLETLRLLPRVMGLNAQQMRQFYAGVSDSLGYRLEPITPLPPQPTLLAHRQHCGLAPGSVFCGRAAELAGLETALRNRRPAVVSGMGGVGKTRLAQETLRRLVREFAHGCEYLSLSPNQGDMEVLRNIAHLLGVQVETQGEINPIQDSAAAEQAILAQMHLQLGGAQLLFLVDNVESAEQVRRLVKGLPQITWIFTTRKKMNLKTLGLFDLSLQLPDPDEAAAIFTQMAPAAAEADPQQVRAIVERLGRLPLALRLAAGMLESGIAETVADLHAWLQARSPFQTHSIKGQLSALCQSLLEAAPPNARRLFLLCGLFVHERNPATLISRIARRLGYETQTSDWEALAALALVDFPESDQVALHPLLHEYAQIQMEKRPTSPLAWQAYDETLLEYAEEVAHTPDETQRNYWRLSVLESDLLRLGTKLHQQSDWPHLKRLYPALTGYLWSSGNQAEYDRFDALCLEASVAGEDRVWEAKICAEVGFLRYEQDALDDSERLLQRAQAIVDPMPSAWLEKGRIRRYRALVERKRGNFQSSLALLAEAESCLDQVEAEGNILDSARLWLYTARMGAYYRLNQLDQALAAGKQAESFARRIQVAGGYRTAGYKIPLGDVHLALGDEQAALQSWQELLAEYANRPPLSDHAEVHLRLGWVYAQRQETELSRQNLETARNLYARFGDVAGFERAELLWQSLAAGQALPDYRQVIYI